MRKCCRNCHFLCKTHRTQSGEVFTFTWDEVERKEGALKDQYAASCFMGVWDTGVKSLSTHDFLIVLDEKRDDLCFFQPNRPGMSFSTAKILQERESQNTQLRRTNIYTLIGLWIAAIALVANVGVAIFELWRHID